MNTRCYEHKDREIPPRLCSTCQRIGVEAELVEKTVDALLAAGYLLRTDIQEDPRPATPTAERDAILREMMDVDDEFLGAYKTYDKNDARPDGWVRFVYGNDGYDVVSDYTTNLESVLAPVNAYADTLC